MADSSVLVMLLIRFTVTTMTYKSATFSPKHLILLLLDHTSKTVPLYLDHFLLIQKVVLFADIYCVTCFLAQRAGFHDQWIYPQC